MKRPIIKLIILVPLILLLGMCIKGGGSGGSVASMCPLETALLLDMRDPLGTLEILSGSKFFEAYAGTDAAGERTRRFQANLAEKHEGLRLLSAIVKRVNVAILWDDPRVIHPFDMGPPVVAFLDLGSLRIPAKFILTAMTKGGRVYAEPIRGHTVFNTGGFSVVFVDKQAMVGSQARVKMLLDVYDGLRPNLKDATPSWRELSGRADPEADITGYLLDARLLKVKTESLPGLPVQVADLLDLRALDGAVFNAFLLQEGPVLTGEIRQREGRSFLKLLDVSRGEPRSNSYLSDDLSSVVILRLANPTELTPILMQLISQGKVIDWGSEEADALARDQTTKLTLIETGVTAMLAQIDKEMAVFTLEPGGPRVMYALLEDVGSADVWLRMLAKAAGVNDFTLPADGEISSLGLGQSNVYVLLRGRDLLISTDIESLRRVDDGLVNKGPQSEIRAAFEHVNPDGSFLLLWNLRDELDAQGKLNGLNRDFILKSWRGHLGIGFTVQPDRTEFSAFLPVDLSLPDRPGWWERQTFTKAHKIYLGIRGAGLAIMLFLIWLASKQVRIIARLRRESQTS